MSKIPCTIARLTGKGEGFNNDKFNRAEVESVCVTKGGTIPEIGRMLVEHWSSEEKVNLLFQGGDMTGITAEGFSTAYDIPQNKETWPSVSAMFRACSPKGLVFLFENGKWKFGKDRKTWCMVASNLGGWTATPLTEADKAKVREAVGVDPPPSEIAQFIESAVVVPAPEELPSKPGRTARKGKVQVPSLLVVDDGPTSVKPGDRDLLQKAVYKLDPVMVSKTLETPFHKENILPPVGGTMLPTPSVRDPVAFSNPPRVTTDGSAPGYRIDSPSAPPAPFPPATDD